jgi:RNA polymerase sigma factor (sigma-70 family)
MGEVVTTAGREAERRMWSDAAADFAAYRSGDRDGLDRLVHRLTSVLWHVVRAYGLDSATAEDVVQSTWLALMRNAERVEDPQAVGRWLTVTARREAWRVAKQAARLDPSDDEQLDVRPDTGEEPEAAAVRQARDEALWQAVGLLSERCQRLLRVLAFVDRPSYTDLSAELGMPVGGIGPTRGRCLEKLRTLLVGMDWRTA